MEGLYGGEVIFNTSMGGYQEICTDPSYAGQIVVFTKPHIGNTGTNEEDNESSRCWLSGVVVREQATRASSWRSTQDFSHFLRHSRIPCLYDVDTRKLTHHIRERGPLYGCIAIGDRSPEEAFVFAKECADSRADLLSLVSTPTPYLWDKRLVSLQRDMRATPFSFSVCVYDFGVKRSILSHLVSLGCRVTVVPHTYSLDQLLSLKPDGIVLSNGPGDPRQAACFMPTIEELLRRNIPLFGICFGCQLLGLAAGGTIVRMKVGHHGTNHPVIDLSTRQTFITSQNHGYVIAEEGLPNSLEVTHRSLVDGSIEGVRLKERLAFGFQGHPEGGGGPVDICTLFNQFIQMMSYA